MNPRGWGLRVALSGPMSWLDVAWILTAVVVMAAAAGTIFLLGAYVFGQRKGPARRGPRARVNQPWLRARQQRSPRRREAANRGRRGPLRRLHVGASKPANELLLRQLVTEEVNNVDG
jgi:hypothetical protein